MNSKWYEENYRRILVDMHIEQWNSCFLENLIPQNYMRALEASGAQTAMLYANSHVGLCYWPSPYQQEHPAVRGKNFLGEMLERCRRADIKTVVYFTLVYDNACYEAHPAWRNVNEFGRYTREQEGQQLFLGPRYGTCCVNNGEYKTYVKNQLRDLMERFDFDGFFLDMTFWPVVCQCPECRRRLRKETGMEIPGIVDWTDPAWLAFQKKREAWMSGFAQEITDFIHETRPALTVEHQYSSALFNWRRGVTEGNAYASDYVGGDLYGGITEQSFACKLYRNLSQNQPFEYMTSRCDPNLNYHTCTKSEQSLRQHAYTTFAHGGAFLMIDAIDPDGTQHLPVYQTIGKIFSESQNYEPYLGGTLVRDAAVYLSLTAKVGNPRKAQAVTDPDDPERYPHLNAALGAANSLMTANIPYDVISKKNLKGLEDVSVLILPDIALWEEEEAQQVEAYVRNGGKVYLSGLLRSGRLQALAGIRCLSYTGETATYMAPVENPYGLLAGREPGAPLSVAGPQCLAEAADSTVLAKVVLPYTDPEDSSRFASIHSNPPGRTTEYPAITYRAVGKGGVLWTAAPLEVSPAKDSRDVFLELIQFLCPVTRMDSDAPAPVELLTFRQEGEYIIHAVNQQNYDPLVEARDLTLRLRLEPGEQVKQVVLEGKEQTELPFRQEGTVIQTVLPRLKVYEMLRLIL